MSKKQNVSLSIICCGVKYSPKDPETYWFFSCYKNDYTYSADKEYVGNAKVYKTIMYELACRQHGCTKLKILKYSKNSKLLEVEDINKQKKAVKILDEKLKTAKEIPIRCPIKRIPYAKRIQIFYGYGFTKQNKMQQISLDGFTRGEIFRNPVKVIKE